MARFPGVAVNGDWISELLLALRLLVGGIFLLAGWNKVRGRLPFERVLCQVFGLGPVSARILAAVLPWLELVLGTVMVLGIATRVAGVLCSTLLGGFALALMCLRMS